MHKRRTLCGPHNRDDVNMFWVQFGRTVDALFMVFADRGQPIRRGLGAAAAPGRPTATARRWRGSGGHRGRIPEADGGVRGAAEQQLIVEGVVPRLPQGIGFQNFAPLVLCGGILQLLHTEIWGILYFFPLFQC